MRVAVCFWGLCRSTQYTIESIERNIFGPLITAGTEFDVYVHTYRLEGPYKNPRSEEAIDTLPHDSWLLLHPTQLRVENQSEIDKQFPVEMFCTKGDPWADEPSQQGAPHHTLQNHIRALYSLHSVTSLWETSGNSYDTILYCRPDVRFCVPLKLSWLTSIEPKTVGCPSFQLIEGWNDRFAIANPAEARIWGHRFLGAHAYSLQKPLHSERYLADTMKHAGIQPLHIRFPFRRIRADGRVCPADLTL